MVVLQLYQVENKFHGWQKAIFTKSITKKKEKEDKLEFYFNVQLFLDLLAERPAWKNTIFLHDQGLSQKNIDLNKTRKSLKKRLI